MVYQLTIKQFAFFFLPGCYEWFVVSNANEIIILELLHNSKILKRHFRNIYLTSDRKRSIDVLQMRKHSKKKPLPDVNAHKIDVSVMYVCYQILLIQRYYHKKQKKKKKHKNITTMLSPELPRSDASIFPHPIRTHRL